MNSRTNSDMSPGPSREKIRLECLRLALDCREAGQGMAAMVTAARTLESYVCETVPAAPPARKPGRR